MTDVPDQDPRAATTGAGGESGEATAGAGGECARAAAAESDLVAEPIVVASLTLDVLRPRDPEALLDEDAFEHEEFLPYWAELWPSAPVLGARLAERGVAGLRILELGCGLGVTGLAAAALGAEVTATDWAPDALELLTRNAARNGVELTVRRLDWFAAVDGPLFADPGPPAPHDGWPLVVAADVLYEARHREPLLATLDRVVAPDGEAWMADPGRPPADAFWALARVAGWRVTELPPRGGEEATVRILRRR
ncbi:class I SAM-dependent methyltransferase [Patulibacter americanus]|uniref:class I SAM-dependent methyltransferase n=1 Tax=Patulibacter americanus TaxID=588672 RepID=UPI000418B2E8|nr:methyltransferase [Patulibacter americanus]